MRILVTLFALAVATAATAADFSGKFVNSEGEVLELRQTGASVDGQVTTGGISGKIAGKVEGGRLVGNFVLPWGERYPFTGKLSPQGVLISLAGESGELFRRVGGAPAAAPSPARGDREETAGWEEAAPTVDPRRPAGDRVPAAAAAPAEDASPMSRGGAASGREYRSEYQGWAVRFPKAWKGGEREGVIALGSDTEAGLITIQATEVTDPETLRQGLAEDLAAVGRFEAPPALKPTTLPAGRGFYTEVGGQANDGTRLKVRAVGVVGQRGTVAVIGATTPEKFGVLAKRVDEVARSVTFFKPKVAPGAKFVAGEWWSFTSAGIGATGGTEKAIALCSDGRYFSNSESSYSGGGSDQYGNQTHAWGMAGRNDSGGGARWRAEGGAQSGRIYVTWPGGNTSVIEYQAKGGSDGMYFDGRLYGRTGGGNYCR